MKKGRFDDMADDLPWSESTETKKPEHPDQKIFDQQAEYRRQNTSRRYKPQRNRWMLVICECCDFKCRCSKTNQQRIISKQCPACGNGQLFEG